MSGERWKLALSLALRFLRGRRNAVGRQREVAAAREQRARLAETVGERHAQPSGYVVVAGARGHDVLARPRAVPAQVPARRRYHERLDRLCDLGAGEVIVSVSSLLVTVKQPRLHQALQVETRGLGRDPRLISELFGRLGSPVHQRTDDRCARAIG